MGDEDYMKLAIQLAAATVGQTRPNPAVGAVVVKSGRVIGVGAHLKAGEAHAEVQALRMAGDQSVDSTLYVTLEPCAHFGRTPPCADLIVRKRLKRVVIATRDPNPLVAGKGTARMRAAGIQVDIGLLEQEAAAINCFFFHYIRARTPFVTLKTACSLDGKTATRTGESQWITGRAARRDGQKLRERYDAVLVGIGTALADNPRLSVRLHPQARQPVRVVLDTHLRIPEENALLTDAGAPTWIITGCTIDETKAARIGGGHVVIYRMARETVDVRDVLTLLGEKEITSLLVEGGATVHGSFLQAGAVDRLVVYAAPKLIGGTGALPAIGGAGVARLTDAARLTIKRVEKLDGDLKIVADRDE
ncbi:MAG: bifunctional diaminohydroxyphosphoribosylaminopyrimidine deaminase/5-amino-6-(5-phosphoribosylamino)uracil reductase RibD [Sporolactobacillus sp.]|jgi:diaminohydroxyphosphoribosylaminopyrimidine deaminase/5-amino-6-(5-phosphoribosylamino)uracil reductase|nr:bifunctional diaminohydroxyphosphoribosylaminopyrimidine deaminase/5-amino-6-(5-phosphoribosylamino)uracil reductase RibD [Sporolactobacillus sp.]